MKTIPLTQGKVAIVDDEDYEELNRYKWYANLQSGIWYARRHLEKMNEKNITMHRQIMGSPCGKFIDHINQNGLNNRKENLRTCTRSQNCKNSLRQKNNSSGFNGVCWHKRIKKWQAYIQKNKKIIHLGYFVDINEAGRAVDTKAKEFFGEFAVLNFPEEK